MLMVARPSRVGMYLHKHAEPPKLFRVRALATVALLTLHPAFSAVHSALQELMMRRASSQRIYLLRLGAQQNRYPSLASMPPASSPKTFSMWQEMLPTQCHVLV
jgi:hypothetical protein